MKIYIAGPLFNQQQVAILEQIETILTETNHTYYSPRLDSGSDKLTPEDKKVFENWTPVFKSNEQALWECDAMIAVVEYAMSDDTQLGIAADVQQGEGWCDVSSFTQVELPDSGTVWEMGYMRCMGKPIIIFHSGELTSKLNLMLIHGVDEVILGFDNLRSRMFECKTHEYIGNRPGFTGEIE